MILLIDNYDSFTYNLVQRLGEMNAGIDVQVVRNDKITPDEVAALAPSHIIVSPGPCTPREAGVSNEILRRYAPTVPTLGVCLGHQCIGHVFGGEVIRNYRVMHGKVSPIFHDNQGVFHGLSNPFAATRYHSLVIKKETFHNPDFVISAWTEEGEIMGVRHKTWPLHGVQFHPESFLTLEGPKLLKNFVEIQKKKTNRRFGLRTSGTHMPALIEVPEQRVVLRGVSWDAYTRLSSDCAESHAARFTYDRGILEIMVLSFEHESLSRLLAALFEVVDEERDLDFENAGSTTFQREDLGRGFEADTAYYVQHAGKIRGKKQIILGVDPPPDLVIEVDVSHSSLAKLPILAATGVGEVWHFDGARLTLWALAGDSYSEAPVSQVLPDLNAQDIQTWLEAGQSTRRNEWAKKLRQWSRSTFRVP